MDTFIAILERDDDSQRRSILLALPDLGSLASRALPALDNIVKNEPAGSLGDLAKALRRRSVPRPNKLTPRARRRQSRRQPRSDWLCISALREARAPGSS